MKRAMELLSPAGDFERLRFAARYGADAVYVGAKRFGLRALAENFTFEELQQAAALLHGLGKRLYVTVNAFLRNSELPSLPEFLQNVERCGADAIIVTDPAVISCAREHAPNLELHLSTQANTTNAGAARFWHSLGVKRIVLARELSLEEIRAIRQETPDSLELECFVHGAMCISYSGRCLLSNFLNGRDGNRGACVQPCRWKYELREQGKDGEWMPVEEDGRGTYLLNSRDLNLVAHLAELQEAGIDCVKIEGRMKTALYVAAVTNAYRLALDGLSQGKPFDPCLAHELNKLRHRPYTTGFLFPDETTEQTGSSRYEWSHEFVFVVLESEGCRALVEQRNLFALSDTCEVLSPGRLSRPVRLLGLTDLSGAPRERAPHPCERLWVTTDTPLMAGDIVRKAVGAQHT